MPTSTNGPSSSKEKDKPMTLPKRIRLLKVLHAHLYSEVKETLASDKEIRNLKLLDSKVERYYLKQVKEVSNG